MKNLIQLVSVVMIVLLVSGCASILTTTKGQIKDEKPVGGLRTNWSGACSLGEFAAGVEELQLSRAKTQVREEILSRVKNGEKSYRYDPADISVEIASSETESGTTEAVNSATATVVISSTTSEADTSHLGELYRLYELLEQRESAQCCWENMGSQTLMVKVYNGKSEVLSLTIPPRTYALFSLKAGGYQVETFFQGMRSYGRWSEIIVPSRGEEGSTLAKREFRIVFTQH
ncbi:MAG: hypothetical protein A2731_03150 [Candidatus Buchananbacteria bacterium RIFCSPHIGHO2_01_FULL_39_8]|uniref:Lipoprotein n=1 Tax=Candidatus Buchananbacteria bacterium RIFCSPHIGHO2_01_FULL_39_8 TaxID=1797533 RepID=A0A1G1XYP3_9BACT|nr:MAG: hypothetical protein A2731_03150 [Candidatus Buchananbacteria bacterium RIFCSPHIGHO2_01_FULL_39_8]